MTVSKLFALDFAFTDMVCQDLAFGADEIVELLAMLDKDCNVYPIWLCPFVITRETNCNGKIRNPGEIVVDIGVYG